MVTPQYERIVGGTTTSVTLSGLEPGTTYRIRVWSTDGTSVSSGAREVDVTTVESGKRCNEHVCMMLIRTCVTTMHVTAEDGRILLLVDFNVSLSQLLVS